ncbi:MAG: ferritin-like domain-containing protein [Geminicoccaceae bacterium]
MQVSDSLQPLSPHAQERRTFLRTAGQIAAGGLAAAPAIALTRSAAGQAPAAQGAGPVPTGYPIGRDVAVLRFLAAAEQIETDLWQQYAELAQNNHGYSEALEKIDDDLGIYSVDVTEDELSHARFINAYLKSIGEHPVDLSRFATIMPPPVDGLRQVGRLTNLTRLSIDTSYYLRYRSAENPDFGFVPPQIATIRGRPAIPTRNGLSDRELSGIAQTAAFHFPSIEQGGTSLYDQFAPVIRSNEVVRIVSSIYATEAIHYAIFRDSLTGVTGFDSGDGTLMIPNLTEGRHESSRVMPRPCDFLRRGLPKCAVIRPSSTALAGARATAGALKRSGLFTGQSPAFFAALGALADAADGIA